MQLVEASELLSISPMTAMNVLALSEIILIGAPFQEVNRLYHIGNQVALVGASIAGGV